MPTLALSMIVKNAAGDLRECLQSVRGIADEIVVADTGSSDNSIEIALATGAKVISIPWENDFAKARNLSLAKATADWVLILDADERLDPRGIHTIPALMTNPNVAGYQVTIRNYVLNAIQKIWDRPSHPNDSNYAPAAVYPAYIDHENIRLFRRDPEIYFRGRVHETVGWRIRETGGKLGTADFCIHHFGMVRDAEALAKKILFYRDLGRQKLAEMPDNSQAHLEVGIVELENLGNIEGALTYFQRACVLYPGFGVAWFFAGKCYFLLGQFSEALRALDHAEASGHTKAVVAEMAGDANYNLGNYEAAANSYRRAVKRDPASATLESKFGLAEARSGNGVVGLQKLRRAIQREPANPELYDRLIMTEVWLNHLTKAAEEAENKIKAVAAQEKDFLRAASICAQMKEWERAANILREGVAALPESESLRANLAKVEVILGPPAALRQV